MPFSRCWARQVQQEGERSQKQVRRRTEVEQPPVTPDGRRSGGQATQGSGGEGRRRRQRQTLAERGDPQPGTAGWM